MSPRLAWCEQHLVTYPDALPITARIQEIALAVNTHQVVIVAGETGSGKTTQLPKIMLQLGRGRQGRIGHTQPRRVAARSVAARIAEELSVELGAEVGYQVRFQDRIQAHTYVKLMTDGILLAELKHDRLLKQYDTLIIDEAHERSLNIDFLLGYLKQLLPQRPDLKLIITSATLDHQRFAQHFTGAKLIEVSGRGFPVSLVYRPMPQEQDVCLAIYAAIGELWRHDPAGDILVFLSGEGLIRDVMKFLHKQDLGHVQVLPLFARLSPREQQAIFHPGVSRRIILATNVAETSLTVPGIRYVIDTGLARLKRYSYRSKIQRLPIEAIAQANANQRAGRCGRISPGVCIRLYEESEFDLRPLYTEPEILRSHLAAVILQMLDLGLGDIERFPFLDPPDSRYIRDGERCLQELHAVSATGRLTPIGQQLLAFPLDPRLGRILIEAKRRGVLPWAIVIVAALSCQDVRERPMDKGQAADQAHAPYVNSRSDFVTYLHVWQHLQQQQQQLSNKAFKDYCQRHYFSTLRFKDWQDLHQQLQAVCRLLWPQQALLDTPWSDKDEAAYAALHKAVLSGFASHALQKLQQKEYLGTRSRKLTVFPGSGVYKKAPQWLMCAEMIETSQVYARQLATIEPGWVIEVAEHLVKRTHSEPQYDAKRGEVFALEKVLLLGLTLIEQKRVSYAKIDAAAAHRVFIREALAERRYDSRLPFFKHNQALFDAWHEAEQRSRNQLEGLPIDDLVVFFEERVPAHIVDVRAFETWYKQAQSPNLLCLDDAWLQALLARQSLDLYPTRWLCEDYDLSLSYQFAPGTPADGVSLHVPLLLWRQLPKQRLAWLVPGLLPAKIQALFKHLPKSYRRSLPSDAGAAWQEPLQEADLLTALSQVVLERHGLAIPRQAWLEAATHLPVHLHFYIQLWDGDDLIATGRDLQQLDDWVERHLADQPLAAASQRIEHLPDDTLPQHVIISQGSWRIPAYLAWQDTELGVMQTQWDSEAQAQQAHHSGVLYWLKQACAKRLQAMYQQRFKPMLQSLSAKAVMPSAIRFKTSSSAFFERQAVYLGDETVAWQDIERALLTENFAESWWLIRDKASFEAMFARHQMDIEANAEILLNDWRLIVERLISLRQRLSQAALDDIEQQLSHLIYPGFFAATPYPWRERLAVYLQGIDLRCQKGLEPNAALQADLAQHWRQWLSIKDRAPDLEYRFMLEEYRLSVFAQSLKTIKPVSAKRLAELYQIYV